MNNVIYLFNLYLKIWFNKEVVFIYNDGPEANKKEWECKIWMYHGTTQCKNSTINSYNKVSFFLQPWKKAKSTILSGNENNDPVLSVIEENKLNDGA